MTFVPTEQRQPKWKVILAFALVYVFWGSTYWAIHEAVGTPERPGIPPLLMSGTRFLIAGPLLLAFFALRGKSIAISKTEAVRQAAIGFLLLTISNTVLAWAEQWVPTGLAALLISITPIWFLALETWILPGEHRFSGRALIGIALGILGIAVLLWPQLRNTSAIDARVLFASLCLPLGSLSWATGSVLSKRWKFPDPFIASGWQMTFGGAINLLLGTAMGQHERAVWSVHTMSYVIYLVIFGSWVGFTAYIWLLKNVPIPKVTTYAYVNPVVAVFLGWLLLHEQITSYILAGSVIVVMSVALVTGAELQARPGTKQELPEVEYTGD